MRLVSLAFLCGLSVHAALITTAPLNGTTTVVGTGSTCAGGPIGAFTVTATGPVCWPYSEYWGFVQNGTWNNPDPGFGLIGINSSTGSFTLDLGASYASAGVFLNYLPASAIPTISVLAGDGLTVLESYDIHTAAPISTPNSVNDGAFRGISRPSADIRFLRLADSYIAVHSITVASDPSPVPEPSHFLLLTPALFFLLRRRSC